jgi:large subunit ribosomal protein L21
MAIYAVIKTGGKQYRVAPGDIVKVEKLAAAPGATVEISEIYLLANENDITAGNPTIAGARVVAEVIEEGRHKKVIIFKQKRRKHYQRTIGHRQYFTTLRISEITLGNNVYKAEAAQPFPAPSNISPQKETAPIKPERLAPPDRTPAVPPDFRSQDTVAKSAGAQYEPPVKLPEPIIAAPETISPIASPTAPSRDTPPESRIAAAASPITDNVLSAEPSTRENLRYWLAGGLILLLLALISFFLFGNRGKQADTTVPVSTERQQTTPEPKPSKPKPVRDVKIKKPAAGSTPSAPVRPPD